MQEHTHAVYCCYSLVGAMVVPLPFNEEELPLGWEHHGSYPGEQEAEKAKAEFCFSLNPEYLGSIR